MFKIGDIVKASGYSTYKDYITGIENMQKEITTIAMQYIPSRTVPKGAEFEVLYTDLSHHIEGKCKIYALRRINTNELWFIEEKFLSEFNKGEQNCNY
jgi:hypothetical protein